MKSLTCQQVYILSLYNVTVYVIYCDSIWSYTVQPTFGTLRPMDSYECSTCAVTISPVTHLSAVGTPSSSTQAVRL